MDIQTTKTESLTSVQLCGYGKIIAAWTFDHITNISHFRLRQPKLLLENGANILLITVCNRGLIHRIL